MRLKRVTSILLAGAVLVAAGAPSSGLARECGNGKERPFKEVSFFIEFNATDMDTGVQMFLDADEWRRLTISNPKGHRIFDVNGRGILRRFGLTELFFESVEPELADLPLVDFLALFPEGGYIFEGKTVDGACLKGEAEFTHALPCGPEVMPEDAAVLDPGAPVVIRWGEVTEVVDAAATDAAGEVVCADAEDLGFEEFEIDGYEVIVNDLDVTLPSTALQLTVPAEMIVPDTLYEFEVLAKEGGGNQTITEGFFCTGPTLTPEQCEALAEAAP